MCTFSFGCPVNPPFRLKTGLRVKIAVEEHWTKMINEVLVRGWVHCPENFTIFKRLVVCFAAGRQSGQFAKMDGRACSLPSGSRFWKIAGSISRLVNLWVRLSRLGVET